MSYIIGIAGGSGSGKTTFAKKILKEIPKDIALLHMDSYYLPSHPADIHTKKGQPNFDHPAAFDWKLVTKHLEMLKNGEHIDAPIYDFKTSSRLEETVRVNPNKVILFEGIFTLFDPMIRDLLNICCFLHVDADIRFTRRLHRDVNERNRSLESVIDQYYDSVRPMYQKYLAPQKDHADFIVGEETDIASSILSARVRELIKNL